MERSVLAFRPIAQTIKSEAARHPHKRELLWTHSVALRRCTICAKLLDRRRYLEALCIGRMQTNWWHRGGGPLPISTSARQDRWVVHRARDSLRRGPLALAGQGPRHRGGFKLSTRAMGLCGGALPGLSLPHHRLSRTRRVPSNPAWSSLQLLPATRAAHREWKPL